MWRADKHKAADGGDDGFRLPEARCRGAAIGRDRGRRNAECECRRFSGNLRQVYAQADTHTAKDRGGHTMTPRRAIRQHCLNCCLGSAYEVQKCQSKDCVLFPYRSGHRADGQKLGPLKAIRAHCLACGEPDSYASVRDCKMEHCKLHQFRFGHNPRRAGKGKIASFRRLSPTKSRVDDADSEKGIQVCLS